MYKGNYGEWYASIIKETELVDYGPNKGDIIIRPYSFAIWKNIVNSFCEILHELKYEQAYFPLLLSKDMIDLECKKIKDFRPRTFEIEKCGDKNLEKKLIVRPTSETIINHMFSKWINSYRDLPMRIFQVSNIFRWEEDTHPFLKEREILWMEAHAVFETHEQALSEIEKIKFSMKNFYNDYLALPVFCGLEPKSRQFVGSKKTITFDTILKNGKSLQLGALYDLETKFSEIFNVKYHSIDNNNKYCYGINFGLGFRLVGTLVLVHSDDRGLRIPPKVANIQVVILKVTGKKTDSINLHNYINKVLDKLKEKNMRFLFDDIDRGTVKKNIEYWEKRGIPIICLIGDKELSNQQITIIRRDYAFGENKVIINYAEINESINYILNEIQINLFSQAQNMIKNLEKKCDVDLNLLQNLEEGYTFLPWCSSFECEENIIKKYGKIIKLKGTKAYDDERCAFCGEKASFLTLFCKRY